MDNDNVGSANRDKVDVNTQDDRYRQIIERLSAAQAAGGIGSFSVEIGTDIVTATPEFSNLYGLDHCDERPATDFEVLVQKDETASVSCPESRREGNARADVEYQIRRHDTGELRWIARRGEFQRDTNGKPVRFVGVARDITARKLSEQNLRKAQQKLALALEATGVGTFDYDLVNDVLEWDDRCRELFGLPPDASVDYQTFLTGLHPDDRSKIHSSVKSAIDPEGDGDYDVIYRTVSVVDGRMRWVAAKG